MTIVGRLLARAVGADRGCIEYGAGLRKDGYRQIRINGRMVLAHRAALGLFGVADKNTFVLHKCDNRACINKEHLFVGSQKDNVRDMIRKGRKVIGANQYVGVNSCKSGHEFSEENTIHKNERRYCRECGRIRNRKSYRKRALRG